MQRQDQSRRGKSAPLLSPVARVRDLDPDQGLIQFEPRPTTGPEPKLAPRLGHFDKGTRVKPISYYAAMIEEGQATRWLARFESRGMDGPRFLAELLWRPRSHQRIDIVPAWKFGDGRAQRAMHRTLGGVEPVAFDCGQLTRARIAAEACAAENGQQRAMVCAFCACWEARPCPGGCYWVAASLCSACCRKFDVDPVKRAQLEPDGWAAAAVVAPLSSPAKGGPRP
jgi:hypothetical protein